MLPDPVLILESHVRAAVVLVALALPSLLVFGLVLDGAIPALRFRPGVRQEPPLWSLLEVVVALALYLLLLAFVGATLALTLLLDPEGVRLIYVQPLNMIIAGGLTLSFVWTRVGVVLGQPLASLGVQGAPWRNLGPCVLTFLATICPLSLLASAWFGWLEALLDHPRAEQGPVRTFQEALGGGDGAAIAALVVCSVVLAPIFEEVLFRGFLFGLLRRRWGARAAVVISGAVFAAYHGNLSAFLPLFAVGAVLAVVYHRSRSLAFAVLWHALFNAANLLLMVVTSGGGS